MRQVNVVYASDRFYFPYIYVGIKTLYESNRELENLYVYYIQQNVPQELLKYLEKLAENYNRKITIIEFTMPEEFQKILPSYGVASKTTYLKFWFASIFPKEDRVLYLDPDTLVMQPIEEMYFVDLEKNLVAGVIENLPYYHMKASGMNTTDSYINGGMVLCNLKEWRECDFESKALERLKDTTHNLNYDQGILNELCKGKILVIPAKYNVLAEVFEFADAKKIKRRYKLEHYYTQQEIDEAIEKPVIIHFTGFLYGKPLSDKCTHPYAAYFQKILWESPLNCELEHVDISKGQKVRKFFLHHMPFNVYLMLEKYLDIHRRKEL